MYERLAGKRLHANRPFWRVGGKGWLVGKRGNFTATAASSLVARTPPLKARSPPRREAVANRLPNVSVPPRTARGRAVRCRKHERCLNFQVSFILKYYIKYNDFRFRYRM